MSSTITVAYASTVQIVETFSGAQSGDPTATFGPYNDADTLTAATSVPVTKHADFDQALSTGTATINLQALPGKTADETIVGTGLKVQILKLRNKSTNANKITATKGASNGYGLDAAGASWTIALDPGQSALLILKDSAPDIAAGARTIDLTGTGSQVLEVEVVMG